jgi:hypothetical protein
MRDTDQVSRTASGSSAGGQRCRRSTSQGQPDRLAVSVVRLTSRLQQSTLSHVQRCHRSISRVNQSASLSTGGQRRTLYLQTSGQRCRRSLSQGQPDSVPVSVKQTFKTKRGSVRLLVHASRAKNRNQNSRAPDSQHNQQSTSAVPIEVFIEHYDNHHGITRYVEVYSFLLNFFPFLHVLIE